MRKSAVHREFTFASAVAIGHSPSFNFASTVLCGHSLWTLAFASKSNCDHSLRTSKSEWPHSVLETQTYLAFMVLGFCSDISHWVQVTETCLRCWGTELQPKGSPELMRGRTTGSTSVYVVSFPPPRDMRWRLLPKATLYAINMIF